MDIVDEIVQFLTDSNATEYVDTGDALKLLEDAKMELRNRPFIPAGDQYASELKRRNESQFEIIRDLKYEKNKQAATIAKYQKELREGGTDTALAQRVDILHNECIAKEDQINELHARVDSLELEVEEAKAETIRALDVATEINNATESQLNSVQKRNDELWADVVDAENRAGIYHSLVLDMMQQRVDR